MDDLSWMVGAQFFWPEKPETGNSNSATGSGAHLTVGRRAVLEDGDGCSSGEGRETQGPSKDSLVDGVSAPNTWQNRGPENSEPSSNSSIKVENQMLSRTQALA